MYKSTNFARTMMAKLFVTRVSLLCLAIQTISEIFLSNSVSLK